MKHGARVLGCEPAGVGRGRLKFASQLCLEAVRGVRAAYAVRPFMLCEPYERWGPAKGASQ